MRILTAHDAEGKIHYVVVSPPNAPPATVTTEAGLLVTEVTPPAGLDLDKLAQHFQDFRVEVQEAKLIRTKSKAR
jgi:hypothetical protein